jgi:hypothetical protein
MRLMLQVWHRRRRRSIIRETGAQGQFLPSNLPLRNSSNNPLNPITSTTSSTPVGVDRQLGNINRIDQVTKGNAFLSKRNIESKINSASVILCQQPEVNLLASDIAELNLSEAQLYLALDLMMSDTTVAAVKTAHSSNVNVMTTKAPPSFCGVITSAEVDKLVRYSNLLGTEIVNLRSIVDKAAIYTIEMHLSARGYLCGFNKPTDYERWLDWDHRRFTEFMVILFGKDQTKLDKSTDLHANIIKFNFGLNDKDRLGDIRNTLFEQKVLSELSQFLENDIHPEHKTEAGQLELVKLIHRNLTPNNSIMLAMNKVQPPAKTPKEFFAKFLRVRAENRDIWYSANDSGFFKPNSYGSSSNQKFSRQNNDSSQSASQQKR